ncbi:hypothetical protein AB0I60_18310 [Actinosynnema sp. NPDC050436]|uniref:hypothetical protein n=1 Tax=Actinosynnema sp. NPDC050436 TaxID=3155659 RepID=UPI0033F11C7A
MDPLRAAAFGDRPGADVRRAADGPPRDRWFAAVALGGQGHYAAAATLLHPLVRSGDRLIASLAASTLASHRRQLGSHATARRFDALALAAAPDSSPPDLDGVDAAGARADALLGLAADAVGAGRLREARLLHARVVTQSWRTGVRKDWVAAEIELAAGHAERAVEPAERALRAAEAVGATRHVLKSGLVLGVASVVWGTPESVARGVHLLSCDLNHTDRHGLLSLSWPTALMLLTSPVVRNDAETEKVRNFAVNALSCVLRRADPISRRLAVNSAWIPTALLRSGEPPNADPQANFLTD